MRGVFILETKRLALQFKQDGEEGEVTAQFSVFNAIDYDGDITIKGAFGSQQVRIGPWNHAYSGMSVGMGATRETREAALMEGKFFLDTSHGLDTYRTVKQLGDLQEWSYSYDVDEYTLRKPKSGENTPRWDGMVRELKKLTVIHVAPVEKGAGTDTGTRRIKSLSGPDALALFRKLRDGDTLSDEEIKVLAELTDQSVEDVATATAIKTSTDPGPGPGTTDPPEGTTTPGTTEPPTSTEPDPVTAEPRDPKSLFLEYLNISALVSPRS